MTDSPLTFACAMPRVRATTNALSSGSLEQVDGAVGLLAVAGTGELDGGDDVDEFAEALLVEAGRA
jgi:hypothetical protein